MNNLCNSYEEFIEYENKMFSDYQFVDYSVYKSKRLEILSKSEINPEWINYVKYRNPKIAVYPGSFNPFHVGHYNILMKAEQIFDKVIISRGINLDKNNKIYDLPAMVKNRQVVSYEGLLTDFIHKLDYDVTIVRGLRNANDLQYELIQYRFLQDLDPNVKVISLLCDREYEHISSSSIRNLEKYNKQHNYLL